MTQDNEAFKPIRSPLAGWMGGKFQLSNRIVAEIPEHLCYVEPFAGAAWVLFRKPESEVEVINDINRELVTFYRCIQHHLEEFVRYFKWVLVARDEFERLKRVQPDTLTDIQRAARFYYLYYLQQQCFGGRLTTPSFGYAAVRGPKLNLLRIEETLSAAHLRLARAYVECLPYHEVIRRYAKPHHLLLHRSAVLGLRGLLRQGLLQPGGLRQAGGAAGGRAGEVHPLPERHARRPGDLQALPL